MRELEVLISQTSTYVRNYRVEDDFVADGTNLLELVSDDRHWPDGDTGNDQIDCTVVNDHPLPGPSTSHQRREALRVRYADEIEQLQRRFGDADLISDRQGGDMLAAPYGDGLICFATPVLRLHEDRAEWGWMGWFSDEYDRATHEVSSVELDQVIDALLHDLNENWRNR